MAGTSIPKVVEANVIRPFVIEVTFADGTRRRIDIEPLRDPAYFAQMQIYPEGDTVMWPNEADMSPEFLYKAGMLLSDTAARSPGM